MITAHSVARPYGNTIHYRDGHTLIADRTGEKVVLHDNLEIKDVGVYDSKTRQLTGITDDVTICARLGERQARLAEEKRMRNLRRKEDDDGDRYDG